MMELQDLFGFGAPKDIDDMVCAEPLPGSFDARQKFLRRDGHIDIRQVRCHAVVAIAAFAGMLFTEIIQERHPPAGFAFDELQQAV